MPNPLPKSPHDLGVVDQAPANQTDPRVPMAEQFALGSEIAIGLFRRASNRSNWKRQPNIQVADDRKLLLNGTAVMQGHPADLAINTDVLVPELSSPSVLVKQEQYLSLVNLTVEVGAEHDTGLKITFQYRNPANTAQTLSTTAENAKRSRALWILVLSPAELNPAALINALPLANGDRRLTIGAVDGGGFAVGNYQIYARDPNWAALKTYTVHPTYVDVLPVCIVRRLQNYSDRGYTWGYNGEEALAKPFNILENHGYVETDFQELIQRRLYSIFEGKSGPRTGYLRTIQNLTSGAVPGNPGRSGEAAGSPDGSSCLVNDQRSGFSNEERIRRWSATVIPSAGNDGSGRAVVTVGLNTNAPLGTTFSENPADHKIYAIDGSDQTPFGNFISLGGSGYLTWVAASGNTAIVPGSICYVVPGVRGVAGSGLSIPFTYPEAVFYSAPGVTTRQIAPANVRVACADIDQYEAPANNESFIVVLGRERMAIHYIYKRVVIASDGNGTIRIPNTERGCIAFANGYVAANGKRRIDKPVVTGLPANTTIETLVYYPPRSTESWQFQLVYPEYQGLNDPTWLNGATIASSPIMFAHTQGAGLSVFRGSTDLCYSPIAYYLPEVRGGIKAYMLNSICQLPGEINPGAGATFRSLPATNLLPSPGLALPKIGAILTFVDGVENQPRSIRGKLLSGDVALGFRTPIMQNNLPYQFVLAIVVQKGDEQRLLIATRNTTGGINAAIDSDSNTAFDLFRLY